MMEPGKFDLFDLPARLNDGPANAALYYVCHQNPSGNWFGVMDETRKRAFSSLNSARAVASGYMRRGARIHAIVMVDVTGQAILKLEEGAMEQAIKELCAFLPNENGRECWGDYGVRDYLSVTSWTVREVKREAGDGFADYFIDSANPDMPGAFQVRIEQTTGRVLGVWNALPASDDPVVRQKAALLFDLTFTPFMADKLKKFKPIDHPDAGSW